MKSFEERAQIFQPFDSLKGFRQLLKQQEHITVKKPFFSEDELQELNTKLTLIRRGMLLSVCYLENDECLKIQGMVANINMDTKVLQIVKKKIPFHHILSLQGDEIESDPFALP